MADFVILRKSRNALSSFLHVILNIALATASILVTWTTGSPLIGLILVGISKWRMLAVRPRYWELNLKSNLVDLIVGCSFILIAYCSGKTFLPVHILLIALYSIWLVVLKPRSTELATNLQSLLAIFFGSTALTMMSASGNSAYMVVGGFVLGYAAARHILVQGEDKDYNIIILAAGIISAEIAWLCHSWLIVYSFAGTGIIIPQLSIIMVIVAYIFGYVYRSITKNNGQFKWSEVGMPTIFAILIIAIIVLGFSQPIFNV